ncbi:hypothetical protein QQF73_11570 [Marinobacter sp. M216]|uniref:DUF3592 domain-containing protein n=1 Tax=Marinobacter albus TaxID=3030833 RepID=A0ABT7HEI0_9GAMM|nr:hypothetical protein [Marinobacter sp. M216]MDK9558260.1 hypothetical protein [Marinobacter sp. M216]
MNTTEFGVYYVIAVSAIFLLIALVRFSQLKPLFRARQASALVEQNHRARLDQLIQLGIRIEGKGPIHFIAPPPYTPDEELVVGAKMEVWVSDELPGVVLNTRPTFLVLLGRAFFPAFFIAFVLLLPILLILRGYFGAV